MRNQSPIKLQSKRIFCSIPDYFGFSEDDRARFLSFLFDTVSIRSECNIVYNVVIRKKENKSNAALTTRDLADSRYIHIIYETICNHCINIYTKFIH